MDCIIHGVTKSWTRQSNFHFPGGSDGKESACNAGDLGSIPGLEKSPGERNSYPFQNSGLENSMDCIVYGVTKSRTRLSNFHFQCVNPSFSRAWTSSLHMSKHVLKVAESTTIWETEKQNENKTF